jgi:hypothetical protein
MIAPRCTAGAAAFVVDFVVDFGEAFAADFVGLVAVDEPVPEPVAVRGAGGIVARLLARSHEHTFCRCDSTVP